MRKKIKKKKSNLWYNIKQFAGIYLESQKKKRMQYKEKQNHIQAHYSNNDKEKYLKSLKKKKNQTNNNNKKMHYLEGHSKNDG